MTSHWGTGFEINKDKVSFSWDKNLHQILAEFISWRKPTKYRVEKRLSQSGVSVTLEFLQHKTLVD